MKNHSNGPLSGLKILDFSTLLPGPYATQILADMGAEVLRIESSVRVDSVRKMVPQVNGTSAAHLSLNRNKKSLAIDLKSDAAFGIIEKLLQEFDIVIEQFRPGVMDRLGLSYQTLSQNNPELIYCSLTGYGQTACNRDRAGHDINYLALSGLASYSGSRKSGPVLSGTQIADIAGGSHQAVMSILAAVIARQSSGLGQHLDVSICDATFSLNSLFGSGALVNGQSPRLESNFLNGGGFYNYYQTSDSRSISVGSLEPKFAKIFFETIGCKNWQAMLKRPEGEQQLKNQIKSLIAKNTFVFWKDKFSRLDACVEPVLNFSEAAEQPMFEQREMLIEVSLDNGETVTQIAPPVKFSQQINNHQAGRELGEDSMAVLKDLGFDEMTIKTMINKGVIGVNS